MRVYRSGTAVEHIIPLVADDGSAIAAVSGTYRILDQAGVEKVAPTAISPVDESADEVFVTTDITCNTLAAPSTLKRELRTIELTLTTPSATTEVINYRYGIEGADFLEVPKNTFQTLPEALLLGLSIPNIPNWDGASDSQKTTAMMEARDRLVRLRYRPYVEDHDQARIQLFDWVSGPLDTISLADYTALIDEFKVALAKAQIIEADFILNDDPVERERMEGLVSRKVGESEEVYRKTKTLTQGVCRRSFDTLSKYLVIFPRLARS